MKDQMSEDGVDFHISRLFCVHSPFAFPLFVPSPSTNVLSKETTFQSDQPHMPAFN